MSGAARMAPVRIAFYGLFGQGNLGNECTLQALLHHTRRYFPDGRFLAICTEPRDCATRHGIPAVPISKRYPRSGVRRSAPRLGGRLLAWLRRAVVSLPRELAEWVVAFKTLARTDMLIVTGSFLTDFSSSLLDWPYDIWRWSLVARICRCRLLFVSVGAGPVYEPVNRWFIRSALALADFRSYREISTLEFLRDVGFQRDGDRVRPDLAFSLPPAELPPTRISGDRRRVVGIGLMNDPGKLRAKRPDPALHRAYLEELTTLARWLLAHDYDLRLVVGDFVYDSAVVQEFASSVRATSARDEARVAAQPASSVDELVAQLAETDVVVATRFHNVLLALALNKPVISVAFHHKCVSLMNAMGLSRYVQDIGDLDAGRLIEQFRDIEENATALKAEIGRRTDEYRRLLDEQYRTIFDERSARRDPVVSSRPRPAAR